MRRRQKRITDLARNLRKKPTKNEKKLWEHLRKKRLNGYRFVRQKPFVYNQRMEHKFFFIADFYCAEKKAIIELDGKIHDYQLYYDYNRDLVLKKLGLLTLRIRNEELLNIDEVKRKILSFLEE
jgi:very-short-patch-repair endonuclease